jgi:CRP/FNR family nitrogen fixation transcriptional regulator
MLNTATVSSFNRVAPAVQAKQMVQIAPEMDMPGFTMSFTRDEEIFGEGESADFVYKVVRGVVRTYRILDDGRRQISAFHFAGDLFGLEPGESHLYSAEAVSDCEIGLIKRVALDRTSSQNSLLARELWSLASKELSRAQEHLLLLGRKTALERVATFLLEMAIRDPETEAVHLPMSRTDIADYLGLTIETVSRTLTQLEKSGAIALPSCRQIVLRDRNALSRLDA